MCRQQILMATIFIGFILLLTKFSVVECAGNGNDDDMALRKIFVGNIPKATPNRALRNYFQKFGEIEKVVVIEGQGYGFVTMKDAKDAEKACSDPNPIIYHRKAKVHLAAEPWNNLPPRHKTKNQSTQFQAQNYAPKTSHLSSSATPFVPHTQPDIPAAMPSSLSHLATPYVPQTLNLARNATPVLSHIQSGIPAVPLPLAYGPIHYNPHNLHWDLSANHAATLQSGIHVLPQHPLAYQYQSAQQYAVPSFHSAIPAVPLPPLTATALGEQIQNNQNQFQEARRSSMSLDGLPSRTKVRISKPSKTESKSKPIIDHVEDSTSQNNPSTLNNEDLSVVHSVINSKDHRDNQQNIHFGTIDYDKYIEKNGSHTNSDASNFHQEGELAASDKSDGTTSVQESSSKAEDKKTSWADLVEEDEAKITSEESNKQSPKEERESSTSLLMSETETGMKGNAGENENSDLKQQQKEIKNSGQLRRGVKNRSKNKKKKGVANAKGKKTEQSELANFGDLPQILEEGGQKKSEKNKSADTGTSSDFMATVDKERADERAKYLYENLTKFPYGKFLTHIIELPETNDEYESLINDAVDHLDKDPQKTIIKIATIIKGGLQGRRLKYIRLIGAGSLRQQDTQYIYDKKLRDEHVAALEILKKGVLSGPFFIPIPGLFFAKLDSKQRQIFAIYKLALAKRLADLFKVPGAHVTVEEKHFDDSEKEFLTKEYEYTTILSDDKTEENLVTIPSQVAEMGPDDVTLIIILNCSIKMTTDLIKSYGNQSKQLILMESTMNDLYAKKYTKKEDRKNFQENRRKFQIRKPLPMTFLTNNIFQQKDVNDVQICYADLKKN